MKKENRNPSPGHRAGSLQKRLAGRLGGIRVHLTGDSSAIARRARQGLASRFAREAKLMFPTLEGAALAAKAQLLRSEHYARMSLLALKARRRKPQTKDGPGTADNLAKNARPGRAGGP